MFTKLFSSIVLLSNQKSFKLFAGSTRNHLWLLIHFKDLEISNYKLQYQMNNGVRQRKSTEHRKKNMKKQFRNTAEMLEYLSSKSYEIHFFEIEFKNGWKIKEQPQIEFYFYTNSIEERDYLIDKLMAVAGLEIKDKSVLSPNITYLLKATGEIYSIDDELLPDEFWSNEQLEIFKNDYREKYCPKVDDEFSLSFPYINNTNSNEINFKSLLDNTLNQSTPF